MPRLSTASKDKFPFQLSDNRGLVEILLIVIVAASLAIGGYYYYQGTTSNDNAKEHSDNKLELPSDAIKLSGCIPFEGEHWVRLEDLPYGPIYVTYEGEVTALDYMIIPDEIPGEEYARMSIQELTQLMQEQNLSLADIVDDLTHLHFDLPDVSFDHWDMHWTSPHPGINVPHYDVHFYLISEEEKENICPTSTAQDIYTAEILQQLVELNVPGVAAPPTEQ